MNIKNMLVHRCTIVHQGTVIGQDDYGQDIYGDLLEANIPCFADRIHQVVSSDDIGDDVVQRNKLFLPNDIDVSMSMKIRDITDKKGNPVIPGSFITEEVNPLYTRRGLSHFELRIRKE
jgi:hypothetical protein